MQRNPYWPLKGPSFFSGLRFPRCVFSLCTKGDINSVLPTKHLFDHDSTMMSYSNSLFFKGGG